MGKETLMEPILKLACVGLAALFVAGGAVSSKLSQKSQLFATPSACDQKIRD